MQPFDRHERVNSLIKELAAEFIRAESNPNPLITVMHVTTSKDYRNATIFVTTIPSEREQDALIFLKRNGGELRNFMKRKGNFKTIPHFDFAIDAGERHRQHIDDVVKKIERKD